MLVDAPDVLAILVRALCCCKAVALPPVMPVWEEESVAMGCPCSEGFEVAAAGEPIDVGWINSSRFMESMSVLKLACGMG